MANRPFFPTTAEALDALTGIYDFLWPTAAAMWNLRWQVAGYCVLRPKASVAELRSRFAEGSGITGANLRRACIDMTWDQHAETLGAVLLTNLFAIYEGWLKRTLSILGLPEYEQPLQTYGITARLSALQPRSVFLERAIYPVLRANPRHDATKLENWITCYRYFKAVRNKQLHDHGIADAKAEDAYNRFALLATTAALGLTAVPEHYPIVGGSPVRLSLRGVVGFSDVLLRILITVDAELARHSRAEAVFDERWKAYRSPHREFKSSAVDRRKQITNVLARIGFPGVVVTAQVEAALRGRGLANWQ